MDFIKDALRREEVEAKSQSSLLPSKRTDTDAGSKALEKIGQDLPQHLLTLPDVVHNEIQIIYENIQTLAMEQDLKVIGIVGAGPNAGASAIASMLSLISVGRSIVCNDGSVPRNGSGSDVRLVFGTAAEEAMLVDGQLSHPTIHRIFRLQAAVGLYDYLYDGISSSAIINHIPHLNLNVIPSGNSRKVSNHIDSERIRSLFQFLKRKFSRVFVVVPSVLHFAEGRALARQCDGVVLVVRAGQSRREAIEEAKKQLENARANVLGGVLTRRKYFIPKAIYRWL